MSSIQRETTPSLLPSSLDEPAPQPAVAPQPPASPTPRPVTPPDPFASTTAAYARPSRSTGAGATDTTNSTNSTNAVNDDDTEPTVSPQAQSLNALPMEQRDALGGRQQDLQARQKALDDAAPTYAGEASKYTKQFVKDHFGIEVDPDHTYLNRFEPTSTFVEPPVGSDNTPIGDSRTPHAPGTLKQSTSLTDLFIHNYPPVERNDMGPVAGKYGIYADKDPNRTYPPTGLIDDEKLYDAMHNDADFARHYSESLDGYWNTHRGEYTRVAHDNAQLQADLQHGTGQLSDADYQLARAGFGAKDTGRNVSVHPVNIGGYTSRDMLRIVDRDSGRNVLYIPGDEQPIRAFDNADDAWQWLIDSHGQPDEAERFAQAHFSHNDADGRSDGAGAATALKDTATYHRSVREGRGNDGLSIADGFGQPAALGGDPFAHLTELTEQGVKADARYGITSNDDAAKAYRLSWTQYIPVIGGIDQAIEGKTPNERNGGMASSAIDLALLVPGVAGSVGKATARAIGKQAGETAGKELAGSAGEAAKKQAAKEGEAVRPGVAMGESAHNAAPKSSGIYRYLQETHAADSDGLAAYRSSVTLPPGAKPNAQGLYEIDGKRYVTLKRDSTQGNALYEIRQNKNHYELVKPGQVTSWHAPWVRQNEDGSFSAMRMGLKGGVDEPQPGPSRGSGGPSNPSKRLRLSSKEYRERGARRYEDEHGNHPFLRADDTVDLKGFDKWRFKNAARNYVDEHGNRPFARPDGTADTSGYQSLRFPHVFFRSIKSLQRSGVA